MKNRIKKQAAMLISLSIFNLFSTAQAQEGGSKDASIPTLLTYIANYTYYTLQAVNNLPTYLNTITTLALSWLSPDNSDSTANLQSTFVTLTNQTIQDSQTQVRLQSQLSKDLLKSGATADNANDLTYQTILNTPLVPQNDPNQKNKQAYNYIKNAAGINITHLIPDKRWKGNPENRDKYTNFYNTITAVQSYNGYILSRLYVDFTNANQLSEQQKTLAQQASSSDWFSQVASENLSIVLRQLLMYNSQIYILLSQMLEIQKQQLAAQAMTNTLATLGNEYTESNLLDKAIGN